MSLPQWLTCPLALAGNAAGTSRPGGKEQIDVDDGVAVQGHRGADDAVLRVKQLGAQELIDVQDVAVIRWPQYAAGPQLQEHVTDEGGKASSFAKKLSKAGIDSSMLESVKGQKTHTREAAGPA